MLDLLYNSYFYKHFRINIYISWFLYRLTPVYALLLAFFATLFVHMGTGPNWIAVVSDAQGCRQQWWRHLLYSKFVLVPIIIYNKA